MQKNISIRGAREHNLKNVDVEIPRDKLVVMTGLSGSGKSSLAFDTIYAEGQRRYVESLSAYARQFLELMQKPDVDHIEGLSPAISIEQKTTSRNPRSTVGTVTEIYDYLRLLFARVGVPYSPATGLPIESQTVSQMADRILTLPEGTRIYLLAPIVRGRKGEYKKDLADLQKRGFQRVKVDGTFYEIDKVPTLDKKLKHDIDIVVDRFAVKSDIGNRLPDSLEIALKLADGIAVVELADKKTKDGDPERIIFSSKFACPVSGFTIAEIEPRLFSFNIPARRLPEMRRPGHADVLRPVADRAGRNAVAEGRRHRAVVEGDVDALRPNAGVAGQALQILDDRAVEGAAEESARHRPARLGRRHHRLRLRRRPAPLRNEEDVRRRDPEPGTPLSRNGFGVDARRTRALPRSKPLRNLQRLSPEARSARGEDRRQACRRGRRTVDPRRRRLVQERRRQVQRQATRDRRRAS